MMHKKYREAIRRNRNKQDVVFQERLYEISIDTELLSQYKVKQFERADIEWLDFVLDCREKGGLPHDYDVVIGATADDDTALCLKAYWDGLYGKVGSQAAKNTLLNNLETENFGIQYYIGNQDVANAIITNITEINWR